MIYVNCCIEINCHGGVWNFKTIIMTTNIQCTCTCFAHTNIITAATLRIYIVGVLFTLFLFYFYSRSFYNKGTQYP